MTEKVKAIETLRMLLGTMVVFPIEKFDLENVGQKRIEGSVQRPVVEGEEREKVKKKMLEIIESIDIQTLT